MASETVLERRRKVEEMTRAGVSTEDIARALRVSCRTVTRHRKATGTSTQRHVPFTAEELQTIRELLEDGCSYRDACRTVGRTKDSTKAVARKLPGYGWNRQQIADYATALRHARRAVGAL